MFEIGLKLNEMFCLTEVGYFAGHVCYMLIDPTALPL